MKPHPRIRKTVKWGGAAVTVLLVVVWIGSGCWNAGWVAPKRDLSIDLAYGQLWIVSPMIHFSGDVYRNDPTLDGRTQWRMGRSPVAIWWAPYWSVSSSFSLVRVPLWGPALAALALSLAAWALNRRDASLILCPKCNYDRTGLPGAAGARCPECGAMG